MHVYVSMDIVSSVRFAYDWHPNRYCWNKNELKSFVIRESRLSLLLALTFTDDIKFSIDDVFLVDHPIQGIASRRGWTSMKQGDERSCSIYKNYRTRNGLVGIYEYSF
jgi:hypothetical protein